MIREFDKFRARIETLKKSAHDLGYGVPRSTKLPRILKDLADCVSELSKHVEEMEK
jgi:hypothetical protein